MSKLTIVPFQETHLELLDVRQHEADVIPISSMLDLAMQGQCVTVARDGQLLGILGFMEIWKGVLHVFVIPSKHLAEHAFMYVRCVQRYVKRLLQDLPIHRLQTTSKGDRETDRWMLMLGFECEGTLQEYTSERQNYRMWAKLKR